jgi:hypothetical protein
MARKRSTKQRCLVRIHPSIWTEPDWVELGSSAQWAFMDSLFRLAEAGEPSGIYPHAQLASKVTHRESVQIADGLIRIGAWSFAGLGYRVHPYCGWAVVPERRAPIPAAVRRRVLARCGHRCVKCGHTSHLALDHIFPWSLGGPDTEDNLQVLCRSCNSSKGAKV